MALLNALSNLSITLSYPCLISVQQTVRNMDGPGAELRFPAGDYSPGNSAPITAAAAVPPAGNAWA